MTTTQVREHPILFSGPMVRAILEGRKTQTRRVARPKHHDGTFWDHRGYEPMVEDGAIVAWRYIGGEINEHSRCMRRVCPYGVPGDRLWVRHSWWHFPPPGTNPDNEKAWDALTRVCRWPGGQVVKDCEPDLTAWRKRPSIHMPRWACRLTLRVKAVRVERLQAISRDDSFAEGVERVNPYDTSPELPPGMAAAWKDYSGAGAWTSDPVHSFRTLWDSINGTKADASWADNPWVWVVEFEREEGIE